MSALQPIHALNLDSVQQQAFIKYYLALPEKPPTTVRIFDRNDYYSVHGVDATTAAREVFSSISNIKKMGIEPNKLDYLVLSKGNFEILIKKLLLVRRYRVEIYVAEGSVKSNDWALKYKGSPGCLSQLEEVLGEGLGISEENSPCLMAVNIKTDAVTKGRLLGVACVSVSEYQLSVAELTDDDLLTGLETLIVQMAPSECLVPAADNDDYKALKKVMDRASVTLTKLKKSEFSTEGLIQDLNRLLKFKAGQSQDANAFPETTKQTAMTSLAAAVKYMSLLSDNTNFGRFRITTLQTECFLHLDAAALSALNVFPELGDNSNSPQRSLFGLLDRCRTQHGKRLLAQWLRQPLRDINLINERLDIVELLANSSQLRLQLHDEHLRRVPDLQALARRLTRKKANLHDCYKIYQAIKRLPALLQCLSSADNATVHSSISEPISELSSDLDKFQQMVEATIDMDAIDRGDFLVKPSFDEQLQSLSSQLDQYQSQAERELSKAARDLGLDAGKSIKLEINPQNGFYFRVTMKDEQNLRGNKKYTIIDAVKGGVRFKTNALENITEDYVQAKSTYEKEQDKVVAEIVAIAAGYSECLYSLSQHLSRLDVLVSFAVAAATAPAPYCRPALADSADELRLTDVRHPCLEVQPGVSYIPNDVVFKRAGYSECLYSLSQHLSRLDVLVSFAVAAATAPAPYCRPALADSADELRLTDVRHPCLEVQPGVSYIPNDVVFKRVVYSECLYSLSQHLSRLDVLVSFAVAAATAPAPYCRPALADSADELRLTDVRHPCLEVQPGVSYIPNDVVFKRGVGTMHVVTGANMGGKSTWMRSCGLAVLMAHAGCLLPASSALVPRLAALAARVGASDREDRGQSTFMLEMIECAAILRTATPDSLVLVDELGRGTSTYEGCGIAWAIAEELANKCKCFCLFATHYHELTRLAALHPGVIVNSHAEAEVVDQQLLLLHKISPGPALQSLGLHVARLAGLPDSVLEYAEAKQAQLETNLYELETAIKSQETLEGQKLVLDFLRKCKEIQESTKSDNDMMKEIMKLKQDLLKQNNKYVQSVIA